MSIIIVAVAILLVSFFSITFILGIINLIPAAKVKGALSLLLSLASFFSITFTIIVVVVAAAAGVAAAVVVVEP